MRASYNVAVALFILLQSSYCSPALAFVPQSLQTVGHRNRPNESQHCRMNNDESAPEWNEIRIRNGEDGDKDPSSSSSLLRPTSKAEIYSNDELSELLKIHNGLSEFIDGFGSAGASQKEDDSTSSTENVEINSLQDFVVRTVEEITNQQAQSTQSSSSASSSTLKFDSHFSAEDFHNIVPNIRGIASDVDGTLLSKDHSVSAPTRRAIVLAVESSHSPIHPLRHFFLATGKTQHGALHSLGPDMKLLLQKSPGVFIQGLYCVDGDGNVIFEKKLSSMAIVQANDIAKRFNVSLIAYDGNTLYASESCSNNHIDEICIKYGEPCPKRITNVCQHEAGFHKLLLICDDQEYLTSVVRPQLEEIAQRLDCVVTQAIPTMLELLPPGCSKAVGVQKLCEVLKLDLSTQVCAIGDAENDLDMLRLAAIGVAVGNAAPMVKEVADVVLDETNSEGGAGRAIELFGLGKVLDLFEQLDRI